MHTHTHLSPPIALLHICIASDIAELNLCNSSYIHGKWLKWREITYKSTHSVNLTNPLCHELLAKLICNDRSSGGSKSRARLKAAILKFQRKMNFYNILLAHIVCYNRTQRTQNADDNRSIAYAGSAQKVCAKCPVHEQKWRQNNRRQLTKNANNAQAANGFTSHVSQSFSLGGQEVLACYKFYCWTDSFDNGEMRHTYTLWLWTFVAQSSAHFFCICSAAEPHYYTSRTGKTET